MAGSVASRGSGPHEKAEERAGRGASRVAASIDGSDAVCLAGPTASGKSALAMALCRSLPDTFEVISVDSAQVYREMDIGTAKPSAADRAAVPHHLLDVADPAEVYSAARFVADASAAVATIHARGHRPLFVGGTLLYFRALLTGLSRLPTADPGTRRALAAEAVRVGWPALHGRLAERDPATAARIHPNDAQRIQRALELLELTGQPPSALYATGREAVLAGCRYRFALIPVERERLYARIAERFDGMLERGFLEEVGRLRARGDLTPEMPSMRAVGYRQLWKQLAGEWSPSEARARALAATRHYAKRQYTWLRSDRAFERLSGPDSCDELVRRITTG